MVAGRSIAATIPLLVLHPGGGHELLLPQPASTWHGCCDVWALPASPSIGSSLPSAALHLSELYAWPCRGSSLGRGAPSRRQSRTTG
jgi:hypothetical protein